jgi:hypothetical protein
MTKRNNLFYKLITCIAIAFLSAGCVKLDQTLVVNKDASGSLDVSYAISEDAIVQAKAAFKLREQMAMETDKSDVAITDDPLTQAFLEPNADQIKQEIAKYARNGIKLESLSIKTVQGWRNVKMKLTFKNLANVAKADFFQKNGFSLSKTADGNYALQREASSGNINSLSPDMVKLFSPMLAGFNVILNVSVPGKILKTNAYKTSPQTNTATWSYDYDKDQNAFSAIQNQAFSIVFDGKGLTLPTITVK